MSLASRLITTVLLALFLAASPTQGENATSVTEGGSLWVTSMAKRGGDGKFVGSTATGLLLRPADVIAFDAADPSNVTTLYSHPAAVWRVVATDDGKTVASVDYRGNLMTQSEGDQEASLHEGAFDRWCQSLAISADQSSVIAGNEAGKVMVWDLAQAKVVHSVELDGHAVTGLAVSADGKTIAACDGGGHVHLLSWPKLESAGKIEVSSETAWCIAYVEGGKRIAVGSGDRNLYLCDAVDAAKAEVVAKGSDWITQIAVSPGGQIAASEVGGRLHFAASDSDEMTAPSGVWSLAWNGDGQLLVGTRKSGIVTAGRSWNWTEAKPVVAEPAPAQPAATEPAAEEPAAEKPAAEKPAAEKPAAEKPAAEKPAAEKPAAEKSKGDGASDE
ncbi:WD domain, G-beta repeat [Rubripirellula lacrimiformis]|uniref:WD domain, G-beta repeat n=1 Tax=Rubripirellula lacrimiformis TaxID=1930273 RepID=A0A517N756_9BACT|nr:hypothetical protein [Rubripirellula lacrimiformis]QDT02973.1 WD domain, G-beta repeat [Rubripirellula lacrimiformis]